MKFLTLIILPCLLLSTLAQAQLSQEDIARAHLDLYETSPTMIVNAFLDNKDDQACNSARILNIGLELVNTPNSDIIKLMTKINPWVLRNAIFFQADAEELASLCYSKAVGKAFDKNVALQLAERMQNTSFLENM